MPGVEVKIAEDGEILTRGPHVMKGYYKKPEATAEAIDADGWFHTGDIGVLDADGFLTITDRKKDIIVTSGGKNIAPQPIENCSRRTRYIAEVVMIGNQRHFPAALIVPELRGPREVGARARASRFASREDLIAAARGGGALRAGTIARADAGPGPLRADQEVHPAAREFTLEAGELTPTLKVKRRVVEQKYKDVIDRMYEGAA